MSAAAQTIKRACLFAFRAIKFRSFSQALWIDSYENFTPTHGK